MPDVCALYQFAPLADLPAVRQRLLGAMADRVLGSLLIAPEGINGTIAGERPDIESVLTVIRRLGFDDLSIKWSATSDQPFRRGKVRIKREIVTMGVDGIDPVTGAGQYVAPEDWNRLIDDPEVVLIDTRNDYETAIGKFDGAVDPSTESFRSFPDYVDANLNPDVTPKVAMYCTGGIRCEKATALLKQKGFDQVYHLRGGILEYLRTVAPEDSRFRGDCFVFDDRVAVDDRLQPSGHHLCHGCGWAVPPDQTSDPRYVAGVQCPRCADKLTDDQKRRFAMRQSQLAAGPPGGPPGGRDTRRQTPTG